MALRKYAVGGLQGCLISVTGVAFEERSQICKMVQELGGIYSPELKPQCSHLIFEKSGDGGNVASGSSQSSQPMQLALPIKVQYAFKWEIPVVSKEWIYACYSKRMLLEESDFPACALNGIEDNSSSSTIATSTATLAEVLPIKLSDIRENSPAFLHGCHVYLTGDSISAQRLAVLKRLVLASGGVRYTDLETGNLTHIVIHNQLLPNNLKEFLEQQPEDSEVKLVHDNWLFDSFKEGKRLPEDDYEVNKKTPASSQQQKEPTIQKWKSAFNNSGNNAANLTANSSLNGSFLNANANISYGTPRTSLAGGDEFLAGTPNVMESASKILKGKSVYLGALPAGPRVQKLAIKARRAEMSVVENEIEADWCIASVLISNEIYKKLTLHRSPNELRNEIWFEAALDSKSQLPPMAFAHPLPCLGSLLPLANFRKFIISQSGFTGAEREFYTEIIKASGAQYTDSLSKANTHLFIAEPRSGTKFEFAKKWKIECVDLNWLKEQLKQSDRIERDENILQSSRVNSQLSQLSQVKLSFQSVITPNSQQHSNSQPVQGEEADKGNLFKGLVFAISQRLWHRRDELSDMIESLGGVFLWSFDRTCTHYLHQGKLADEAFKEFKQARQWDKLIVSPWWVVKCQESGRRVDELQYPHTFKNADTSEMRESDSRDIETNATNNPVEPSNKTAQAQTNNLDWDAIIAERKAQELLLRPGSKTFNIESHPAFTKASDPGNKPAIEPSIRKNLSSSMNPRYKLIFSGYTGAERSELAKLVSNRPEFRIPPEDEAVEWNPKSTLLICNSLNFTEKIFSACATGCWILKKDFLLDQSSNNHCTVEGNFNFEKYEIGPAWNANERDTLIGRAPKYWRQRLSAERDSKQDLRPFAGWKCALIVENTKQSLYESVLRNGGAQIIPLSSLTPESQSNQITHFFCANAKSIPEIIRKQLRSDQVFVTKHITNTIFRLND